LLALLGAHPKVHINRIKVNLNLHVCEFNLAALFVKFSCMWLLGKYFVTLKVTCKGKDITDKIELLVILFQENGIIHKLENADSQMLKAFANHIKYLLFESKFTEGYLR
jgi:hypothetical protein